MIRNINLTIQVVFLSFFTLVLFGCKSLSTTELLPSSTSENGLFLSEETENPEVSITADLAPTETNVPIVTSTSSITSTSASTSEVNKYISQQEFCNIELAPILKSTTLSFVAEWDGDQEIYSIQADGTQLTQLTKNDVDDFSPKWSPNGEKIAFLRQSDEKYLLYALDYNTLSEERISTKDDLYLFPNFIWSPDSNEIAIGGRNQDYANDIYIINTIRNTTTSLLKSDPRFRGGNANSWSTRDNTILIDAFIDREAAVWRILTVKSNGADVSLFDTENLRDWQSELDPSGSTIVFIAEVDTGNTPPQIFTMSIDSNEREQITYNKSNKSFVHWSPDGNSFLFIAIEEDINNSLSYQIHQVDKTNKNSYLLLATNQMITFPNWASNNRLISFIKDVDGIKNLYLIDICNKEITLLVKNIIEAYSYDWKP